MAAKVVSKADAHSNSESRVEELKKSLWETIGDCACLGRVKCKGDGVTSSGELTARRLSNPALASLSVVNPSHQLALVLVDLAP
jgi:hypothetical protein